MHFDLSGQAPPPVRSMRSFTVVRLAAEQCSEPKKPDANEADVCRPNTVIKNHEYRTHNCTPFFQSGTAGIGSMPLNQHTPCPQILKNCGYIGREEPARDSNDKRFKTSDFFARIASFYFCPTTGKNLLEARPSINFASNSIRSPANRGKAPSMKSDRFAPDDRRKRQDHQDDGPGLGDPRFRKRQNGRDCC